MAKYLTLVHELSHVPSYVATKVIFPSDVIANVTILLSVLVECGKVPVTLHSMCIWAEKNVVH